MSSGESTSDEKTPLSEEPQMGFQHWGPAIAACLAMFIVSINSGLMNVAVPAIVEEFGTTVLVVQGAVSFYSLVLAALMLPGGKLPSLYSIRRVMTAALIVYGVGTVFAAISWNPAVLFIGWSIIEGIAAAVLLPLTYTVLLASYEENDRAKALGLLASVSGAGAAVGPILGGAVTTYASWRWGFVLQLLIVGGTLFFVRYVSSTRLTETRASLDLGGTLLSIIGATTLVIGFLLSGKYGWLLARRPFFVSGVQFNPFGTSPAIWFLGLGLFAFAAFVQYERRMERAGKSPLVPLSVLRNTRFTSGVITYSIRSIVLSGFLFVVPVYLQVALGQTAFQAGLALFPYSLAMIFFSSFTTGWRSYLSPKTLIQIGIVVMGFGLILLYEQTGPNQTLIGMIVPMTFLGTGLGLLMAQIANLTLSAVPSENSGEASGVLNASSSMGYSLGTAVVGSFLLGQFYGGVIDRVLRVEHMAVSVEQRNKLVIALENATETATRASQQHFMNQLTPSEQQLLRSIFKAAMFGAERATLLLLVFIVLLLLVASTFLPRYVTEPDD